MDPESLIGQRYTGPWVSNGKFQKSVSFGDQPPLGVVDSYSRLHDTGHDQYGPGIYRKAADSLYHDRMSKLPGALPHLLGDVVVYGNAGMQSLGNITSGMTSGFKLAGLPGAFAGLIYGGAKNMYELHDYVTHRDEAKKAVRDMEKLDPFPQYQRGPLSLDYDSTMLRGIRPKGETKSVKVEPGPQTAATSVLTGSGEPASTSAAYVFNPKTKIGDLPSVSPPEQRLGGGEYITMVKNNKQTKQKKGVNVQAPKRPKQTPAKAKKSKGSAMGAITAISTAPVAIGNSIRGAESAVVSSGKNGIIVRGRDFMFAPVGTGSVTTWTLCGGTPLSPAAFADTTLATYMRLYAKYRFKAIVVHYITSSPTSANGDVMFYYGKDRSSVFLNQTSPQLLGFVLSDTNTVIGPQWTNHSAALTIVGDWKFTDYGMHDGVEEYADGEVFLLSKTSTTDSPGYVLFDYVIEFADHQLQPRLLEFPIPRIQYHQMNIGLTASAINQGDAVVSSKGMLITGNNISGTAATLPPNSVIGDIYKIILDVTNSNSAAWVGPTVSTLFGTRVDTAAVGQSMTVSDGMTLYAVHGQGNRWALYANPTAAFAASAGNTSITYNFASGGATFNLQVWVSFVGAVNSKTLVPNY